MGIRDWLKSLLIATATVGAPEVLPPTSNNASAAPVPKDNQDRKDLEKKVNEYEEPFRKVYDALNKRANEDGRPARYSVEKKLDEKNEFGIIYIINTSEPDGDGKVRRNIEKMMLIDVRKGESTQIRIEPRKDLDEGDKSKDQIVINGRLIFPSKEFGNYGFDHFSNFKYVNAGNPKKEINFSAPEKSDTFTVGFGGSAAKWDIYHNGYGILEIEEIEGGKIKLGLPPTVFNSLVFQTPDEELNNVKGLLIRGFVKPTDKLPSFDLIVPKKETLIIESRDTLGKRRLVEVKIEPGKTDTPEKAAEAHNKALEKIKEKEKQMPDR